MCSSDLHPGDIARKTLAGMRRIRDVKLRGYHNLRTAFGGTLQPRLWCNFGSVTGVVGLPGESEYSPANDFLSGAAEAADEERGEYTIAWTIWDETGLGSGSVVQSFTARTDRLSRMSTAEGVGHFLDELERRPHDRLVTYIGEAEHRSFDEQFPGLRALDPSLPPRETGRARPAPPPGPLNAPDEQTADHAVWNLSLALTDHPYLRDHLVDGKPTMPGVMLADIAVQAARTVLPDLVPRAVTDLVFTSWVRARTDGRPADYRVTARRTAAPGTEAGAVSVAITSDVIAPDGQVLARDREHFTATVLLGGPAPTPIEPGHAATADETPVPDPYYDPASPVLLTGVFRATREHRAGPDTSTARWLPAELTGLPELGTPSVLLDSLARTPALCPRPDDTQSVIVPRRVERITLYQEASDTDLLRAYPDGIALSHDAAGGVSTARSPDGTVLAQITGAQWSELAAIDIGPVSLTDAA